eukprot:SAG22_NODE_470_length_10142_cov_13.947227_4_plen_232_part_00
MAADARYEALFSPNVWNIIARENIERENSHQTNHPPRQQVRSSKRRSISRHSRSHSSTRSEPHLRPQTAEEVHLALGAVEHPRDMSREMRRFLRGRHQQVEGRDRQRQTRTSAEQFHKRSAFKALVDTDFRVPHTIEGKATGVSDAFAGLLSTTNRLKDRAKYDSKGRVLKPARTAALLIRPAERSYNILHPDTVPTLRHPDIQVSKQGAALSIWSGRHVCASSTVFLLSS